VVFDPPLPSTPRPSAEPGGDHLFQVDLTMPALLAARGPAYEQFATAARNARARLHRHGDVEDYLAARAAELNAGPPQLRDLGALDTVGFPRNHATAHTVQWVPAPLVVGTDHPRWGDFGGHRDDMATRIARGLCASGNLDSFTRWMFTGGEITLLRAPGWAGPIYRLNDDGNHRVHAIRMLQLPWIAAAVDIRSTPASWTVRGW
jgi:hypothetical protein